MRDELVSNRWVEAFPATVADTKPEGVLLVRETVRDCQLIAVLSAGIVTDLDRLWVEELDAVELHNAALVL